MWRLTSSLIEEAIKAHALLFFTFQTTSSFTSIDLVGWLSPSQIPTQKLLEIKL